MNTTDTILVSFDFTHGIDKSVLVVGRKEGATLKIVNAFFGKEAEEMYKKLVTRKEE